MHLALLRDDFLVFISNAFRSVLLELLVVNLKVVTMVHLINTGNLVYLDIGTVFIFIFIDPILH